MSSTMSSLRRWASRRRPATTSTRWIWPHIEAASLRVISEPSLWTLDLGRRSPAAAILPLLATGARGAYAPDWHAPSWLMEHQRESAKRVAATLDAFGGAVLADEVGLGKTYVALAVATRYRSVTGVVPAALVPQWRRTATFCGIPIQLVSIEGLSRGKHFQPSEFVIVDEAHRFRNPATYRYDAFARSIGSATVLLVTATPVVNRTRDLTSLLQLFLPDHALAQFGLPSLATATDALTFGRAAAAVVVAQSSTGRVTVTRSLPNIVDRPIICDPSVPERTMARVLHHVDALRFPTFADESLAGPLLRQHLMLRIASSAAAGHETVRRHIAYLDRATSAWNSGRRLSRSAARLMLGPGDDLQLVLLWGAEHLGEMKGDLSRSAIAAERTELQQLHDLLRSATASPKATRLVRLLAHRQTRRTLVFVTSRATANDLATRLGWKRLAIVAAGSARIASGPIGVERALQCFAPVARGGRPDPHIPVSVLIATDVASEGLDLQDADGVVHYDLPWTPLRLAQRVGRIARLGSLHSEAKVWWFAPPPSIDRRLRLSDVLTEKARAQDNMSVAVTSRVGRARVVGMQIMARTAIADGAAMRWSAESAHSVVRGPMAVAASLAWRIGSSWIPDLIVMAGDPPEPIADYRDMRAILEQLRDASPSSQSVPPALRRALGRVIRNRAWAAAVGPGDPASNAARRAILDRAVLAGRERDELLLGRLDAVLSHLGLGVRAGAARRLNDAMCAVDLCAALDDWLQAQRSPANSDVRYRLLACIYARPDG